MAMKIRWNLAGFRELRTSAPVEADILRRAQAVADACGEGFEAELMAESKTRARAIVKPVTYAAMRQNSTENTILRNLNAGA